MGEQLATRKGPVLTAAAALCLTTTVAALAARGRPPTELARQTPKDEPAMGDGGNGTSHQAKQINLF
ncbi:hypothetical protein COT30_00400 [Candidatus Micrarchaeota archaeon CG08_land_8_20_14_0_20_49_17]|nr:MAG: hypothetical protein AUJ13_03280 [Candidatus Micrarchaeota archaeon CG1_02_49_24]PIU10220.1 MAG: hypothetical protein COT30_00400 [Candidatus Micrarchaeota archaeon CG08_land_8_20_14_0_20_49_17]PIU82534.1 MAG: hypothetical protein COS70_00820 [Candidatus Micrarchaeota archaeon CG06_land_8_20_14_3_00_50_6]PIZ99053.1 MAG: hypothetical protein COX84_01410 [Candidatus Micrarchaeota archaeon CG_4_10_14_0_2_um_filter_49_7]HII53593.1 hypothetical protein [Candidatus Micrarchaeota archaeon]